MKTANAEATAGFAMNTNIEMSPMFQGKMKIQMFNKFYEEVLPEHQKFSE